MIKLNDFGIIIEARTGSQRLHKKILKKISGNLTIFELLPLSYFERTSVPISPKHCQNQTPSSEVAADLLPSARSKSLNPLHTFAQPALWTASKAA